MHEELVSVVMPTYQAVQTLPSAIAAIEQQDWPNLELVVVDDGSTDGTAEVLDDLKDNTRWNSCTLTVLKQANQGAGAARDTGIAAAGGNYILLADADDSCDTNLVSALMTTMTQTGADLAFGRCRYIEADGSVAAIQDEQPRHPNVVDLLRGIMINTPLVRRSALEAIGGHDHTLPGSIDLDIFVRMAMRREDAIVAVPEVLSDYRRNVKSSGQITSNWSRMERSWTVVRDKAIAGGLDVSSRELSVMRGRQCAYWATLAYIAGDHAASRKLILEALRRDPKFVLTDDLTRVRLLACMATLLPDRLHDWIRDQFNARRADT